MAPSPSQLDPAMDRLCAEIAMLQDRLAASSRMLEERSLAMLLAATPLADHGYRVARESHLRLRERLLDTQAALGSLIIEREGLPTGVITG